MVHRPNKNREQKLYDVGDGELADEGSRECRRSLHPDGIRAM
jgi:hypothetical protein